MNGPLHLLLVEDNPGDVRLIKDAFTETDIEIVFQTATDGSEALEMLAQQADGESDIQIDLVLLDLNLPRTDGHEFLDDLQAIPKLSRLPVLVLTSSNVAEDVVRSYELGANAYLTKPESPEEFISVAQAIEDFWLETVQLPPVPT